MAADTGVSMPGAEGQMPKLRWGEGVCRPRGVPLLDAPLTGVCREPLQQNMATQLEIKPAQVGGGGGGSGITS